MPCFLMFIFANRDEFMKLNDIKGENGRNFGEKQKTIFIPQRIGTLTYDFQSQIFLHRTFSTYYSIIWSIGNQPEIKHEWLKFDFDQVWHHQILSRVDPLYS